MVSAAIAQLVEQGTENPCVLGSIPSCGTILKRPQRGLFFIAKKSINIGCIGKHDLVCTGNVIYLGKLAL